MKIKFFLAQTSLIALALLGCSKSSDNGSAPAAPPKVVVEPKLEAVASMTDIKQEGLASNKNILVISSAAWCGPCAHLANDIAEHPDVVERIKTTHVILHIEEMHTLSGLQTYLPFEQYYYPMVLEYNVTKNSWHEIMADGISGIEESLKDLETNGDMTDRFLAQYNEALKSGVNFVIESEVKAEHDAGLALFQLLESTSLEKTPEEARKILNQIVSDYRSFPNQLAVLGNPESELNYMVTQFFDHVVELGGGTLDELKALFPEGYKTKDAGAEFERELKVELYRLRNTQGLQTAATYCGPKVEDYIKTVDAKKIQIVSYNFRSKCKVIEVQAGLLSKESFKDWTMTQILALSEEDRKESLGEISRALASTGNFEFPLSVENQLYEKTKTYLNQHRQELQNSLDQATAANDTNSQAAAQEELTTLNVKEKKLAHVHEERMTFWREGKNPPALHKFQ